MTLALAIAEFVLHLFTGQVWAAWRAHKVNLKLQAIANIPETNKEWADEAKRGDL